MGYTCPFRTYGQALESSKQALLDDKGITPTCPSIAYTYQSNTPTCLVIAALPDISRLNRMLEYVFKYYQVLLYE